MSDTTIIAIFIPIVIFLLVDIVLVIRSFQMGYTTKTEKIFLYFVVAISVLQLASTLTYANDFQFIHLTKALSYLFNIIGVLAIPVSSYTWLQYMLASSPGISQRAYKVCRVALLVPLIILAISTASSPWTHLVFYLDETGAFQNGTAQSLQLITYFYYFVGLFLTAIQLIKYRQFNTTLKRFLLFLCPAAIGGWINTEILRGGYTQIGFSLGAVLMYLELYAIEANENRRLKSIEEVNRKLLKANEELEAARTAADNANAAKTRFLFNMSHDIRTPMNAILGYTDIALNHYDDELKAKEYLNKIKTSGSHLLSLINDILEMSRIESGKLEIKEEPVDVCEQIAKVDNMNRALAMTKDIDMEIHIGDIQNPFVHADELHVNEAIVNVVSNAVKYTGRGGHVLYRVDQEGGVEDGKVRFRFEVTDNGIGMSEEFQQHLFEAFSRENNTTVAKEEGTGLGLSIVKSIIDKVGGTIEVHSKKGEGTTFIMHIPFRVMNDAEIAAFRAQRAEEAQPISELTLRGKRVLYAEDNEINREICEELLSEAGILVEHAEDGSVALKMVSDHGAGYYDAVLMDVQMPVMDGYEATREIRKLPQSAGLPIIALSANAFREDIRNSLDAGMDAHVAKPIDVKILFDTLQQLMEK